MKPAKLGSAVTILDVGCEGGGLTLLRAEVLAWEEPVVTQRKRKGSHLVEEPKVELPGEVFWMERNEVLLCDLLSEEDQVCSPFSQSEYRTTFQEAVTDFMDRYSWWSLYPGDVHPRWREAVIDLLEKRCPGWRGAPSCWSDECHDIERWIEILRPPTPVLTLNYQLRRHDDRPRGIHMEITSTRYTEGKCWDLPIRSMEEDWSKWRPSVPGVGFADKDAARILEYVQQATFSLPLLTERKPGNSEHILVLAMGNSHLQVGWGDSLPIELASLKELVEIMLDYWIPMDAGK